MAAGSLEALIIRPVPVLDALTAIDGLQASVTLPETVTMVPSRKKKELHTVILPEPKSGLDGTRPATITVPFVYHILHTSDYSHFLHACNSGSSACKEACSGLSEVFKQGFSNQKCNFSCVFCEVKGHDLRNSLVTMALEDITLKVLRQLDLRTK